MKKIVSLKEILQNSRKEKLKGLNVIGKNLVNELKEKARKNGHLN